MKLIKKQLWCLLLLLFTSMVAQGQIDVLEAALENDYLSIEESIQKGHNAFEKESSGFSLVEYAISSGNHNLLATIISNTHSISNKDLFSIFSTAIDYKQSDIIEYLLSKNFHTEIDSTEMYNLVSLAVQHDDAQIYQLLSDNVLLTDKTHKDFLFMATRSSRNNVFSFIFNNVKISPSEKIREESLLHQATNSLFISTFLVKKGADINALTTNGHTPLHLTKNFKIAQLLIKNGAKVDIKDKDGYTPLDYAQKAGDTSMIRLFESALKK